MGFAAPALQLADRDHWIGWTVEQRRDSLHMVVNLSRFLIRANVRCANLASRVLSHRLFGIDPVCRSPASGQSVSSWRPDNWCPQNGRCPQNSA